MKEFKPTEDAEQFITWLKSDRDNVSLIMSKINEKEKLTEKNEEFLERKYTEYYNSCPEVS